MRLIRIYFLLLVNLVAGLQEVKCQSYFFKISGDSLIDVQYSLDSVRIISQDNFILYLDSSGFLTSTPTAIPKAIQTDFELELRNGGVQIDKSLEFKHLFSGKSIRYIGPNFVATYQGLFRKHKKFSELTYSNGTIREFGDSVLVSWDGFTIFHENDFYDFTSYDTIGTEINNEPLGFTRDAYLFGNKIFLLTTEGVFSFDVKTQELTTVYRERNERIQLFFNEIGIDGKKYAFMIGLGSSRIRIFLDGTYSILETFDSPFTYYNSEQAILVFPNRIIDYPAQRTISINNNYHFIFKVDDVYYGASDNGLFAYADRSGPLQLNTIEYNARSFRITQESVYLGSVQGLYKYPFDYLRKQATSFPQKIDQTVDPIFIGFVILGVLILIGFTVLLANLNARIDNTIKSKIPKEVTRNILVEYISSNINHVSISGLCNEFNLSQKELYSYFPESSPGVVIKQTRLLKAKSLFEEGKSNSIIAAETGYSKKYLTQTILPQLRRN